MCIEGSRQREQTSSRSKEEEEQQELHEQGQLQQELQEQQEQEPPTEGASSQVRTSAGAHEREGARRSLPHSRRQDARAGAAGAGFRHAGASSGAAFRVRGLRRRSVGAGAGKWGAHSAGRRPQALVTWGHFEIPDV